MFVNGLIKNQLSIHKETHLKDEYYDKSLHFLGCHFDNHVLISMINIKNNFIFDHVLFKQDVYVHSVKTNQNSTFLFENCTINTINMQNNTFLSDVKFLLSTRISNLELTRNSFDGILFVQDSIVKNINLYKNELKNKCYFNYTCFGDKDHEESKINLFNAKFQNDIYFDNSIFYNYADFHACEFKKIASFYGVKFEKTPNFSQAIFKGNLNVVNTNLNFTFCDLQEKIVQEYEDFNKDKKEEYQKSLDKFANDFRDSFRTFKNALIKDNNLLDASNFHKCELYCKELELKNKKATTFKDIVDRCQLFFYRKLCDHHTDILQSLNSLILVIGIFVLSSVVMVANFNYRLGYKPILEHWYFSLDFYNHHINSIIQDNYFFVVKVNFAMLFTYLILVGLALCLKCIREFFIIISYGVTLFVLVVSPKILIPAMGFFTDKRAMLDPLGTIGGIYTIVFGFVVFSFIKTIRKNSIVPS
ncbi:pentapeptide repeat-containing protein [Campylobacter coli]|nr:pentapeptide repeat-containing protein [Campylobacter coli]